jgi:hypothetical protein
VEKVPNRPKATKHLGKAGGASNRGENKMNSKKINNLNIGKLLKDGEAKWKELENELNEYQQWLELLYAVDQLKARRVLDLLAYGYGIWGLEREDIESRLPDILAERHKFRRLTRRFQLPLTSQKQVRAIMNRFCYLVCKKVSATN